MRSTLVFFIFLLAMVPLFGQNAAPVVTNPIAPFSFSEDTTNYSINLNNVFTDPDGDDMVFTATGNSYITVNINNGIVGLTPQSNWNGTETITFTASDQISGSISTTATVTVLGINDPPFVAVPVNYHSVTQNEADTSLNLSVIFSDPDLVYGDHLTYSCTGQNHISVSIAANGTVTLNGGSWIGSETLTFRATDADGEYITQAVTVQIIHAAISNVSVSPNPFSPDNDGQKDVTTISFYASANGTAQIEIYNTTRSGGEFIPGATVFTDTENISAGWNQYVWDGSGNTGGFGGTMPDGSYGLRITVNAVVYNIDFTIKVDTLPPEIDVISSYPNPFSPNGDGYQDFHQVRFRVDGAITEYVGLIRVNLWNENDDPMIASYPGGTYMPTTFVHEDGITPVTGDSLSWMLNHVFDTLTDGGYCFVVRSASHSCTLSSGAAYDLLMGGNVPYPNNMVTVSAGTSIYKIGAYNFPFLYLNGVGSDDHESAGYDDKTGYDYLRLFVVEGNASFNIYNEDGTPNSLNDEYSLYFGSRTDVYDPFTNDFLLTFDPEYNITIPGTIEYSNGEMEDGRYIYRVIVTDQAMHAAQATGELLVNNNPIQVTASVTPTSISPGNHDGYYDQTVIQYQLSTRGYVTVKIWDAETNELVRVLRDAADTYASGYVIWDGTDANGNAVAQGTQHQYTIEISAQDHDINSDVASVHYTVTVDNVGPQAAQIFLLGGDPYVTDTELTVGGISNDVSSNVILYLNGINLGSVATTPTYPGYFEFPVTLSEGTNTIQVRLRDSAWNVGAFSNSVSIALDSSSPIIHTTFPPADTLFRVNTFRCRATISDLEGIGVDPNTVRFGFSLYGNTVSWRNAHQLTAGSNIYYYDYNVAEGVDELTIGMYVQAADLLGNSAQTDSATVFYYKAVIPPDIVSIDPADSSMVRSLTNGQVSVVALDNEGLGLNYNDTQLNLKRLGGTALPGTKTITALGNHQYKVSFTPQSALADSWYQLTAEIKDLYSGGGSITRDTTYFLYDATPPVASNPTVGNTTVTSPLIEGTIINHDIGFVRITIADATAGLNLTSCTLGLYNSLNNEIAGTLAVTANTLTWNLNDVLTVNETNSGNYYINYSLVDQAGNTLNGTLNFVLAGSNAPQLLSSVPNSGAYINALTDNCIDVSFNEAVGMNTDIASTYLYVTSPSGTVYQNGNGATLTLIDTHPRYTLRLTLNNPMSENGVWRVDYRLCNSNNLVFASHYLFTFDNVAPVVPNVFLGLVNNNFTYIYGDDVITQGVDYAEAAITDFYGVNYNNPGTTIGIYADDNTLLDGTVSVLTGGNLRYTLSSALSAINQYYYVKVTAVDQAGNTVVDSTRFKMNTIDCTFYPIDDAMINTGIDYVSISFAFDSTILQNGTDIMVTHPDGAVIHNHQGGTLTISETSGTYTMRLDFATPLSALGDDDGRYQVQAVIMPSTGDSFTVGYTFLLDTQKPIYSSLTINGQSLIDLDQYYFNAAIDSIRCEFADSLLNRVNEVAGVDFSPNSTKILLVNDAGSLIPGNRYYDGIRGVTWRLRTPLSTSGTYTIRLQAQDQAGNQFVANILFLLQFPEITSYVPAANAHVNLLQNNRVKAVINDLNGFGLNDDATTMTVTGGSYSYSPGHGASLTLQNTTGNLYEMDLVISGGLPTDGSRDGEYTEVVTATDSIGAITNQTIHFTYDTVAPVASDFAAYNNVGGQTSLTEGGVVQSTLQHIQFHATDINSPIDTQNLTLSLRNANNVAIAGSALYEAATGTVYFNLTNVLGTSATDYGLYTFSYRVPDTAGNLRSGDLHFSFVDPNAPQVVSYSPACGALIASLNPAVITIVADDTHGISLTDFTATYIRLTTPNNSIIENGYGATETITVTGTRYTVSLTLDNPLALDGIYAVTFQLQNTAEYRFASNYQFTLDTTPPEIRGYYSEYTDGEEVITNGGYVYQAVNAIKTILLESTTTINYTAAGTYLYLTDQYGNTVAGQYSYSEDDNYLLWTLNEPLHDIGHQYVIHVGAVDEAGNSVTSTTSFQLNAFNGEVIAYAPGRDIAINADVSQAGVIIQDLGMGGFNTNLTYIDVTAPDGSIIGDPNSAGHGTGAQLQITESNSQYSIVLLFNHALQTDGTDDGVYNVLVNLVTTNNYDIPIQYSFTYDRVLPVAADLRINHTPYDDSAKLCTRESMRKSQMLRSSTITEPVDSVSVCFTDATSGIDLSANVTTITLLDPSGNVVPGRKLVENNRWFWVLSSPIPVDGTRDGTYQIRLHATDMAGNDLTEVHSFTLFSPIVPTSLAWSLDALYQVHLTWDAVVAGRVEAQRNNGNRDLLYYEIDRSLNSGDHVPIAYTVNTNYNDNLASQPDGAYQYFVRARYDTGASDYVWTDPIDVKRFATVTVTVLADTTHLANVQVHLAGDDGLYNQSLDAVTNSSGVATFTGVFMDHYTVTLTLAGYDTVTESITVNADPSAFTFVMTPTVSQTEPIPTVTQSFQNYPNPFNPTTQIKFGLKEPAQVKITIYNTRGQKVVVLTDKYQTAGFHSLLWDSTDSSGKKVASGMYFYRFQAKGTTTNVNEIRKMILMK